MTQGHVHRHVHSAFLVIGSTPETATQAQLTANEKSSFQPPGTTLHYFRPKCSPEHLDRVAFKGKNHILVSCSGAARGALDAQAV